MGCRGGRLPLGFRSGRRGGRRRPPLGGRRAGGGGGAGRGGAAGGGGGGGGGGAGGGRGGGGCRARAARGGGPSWRAGTGWLSASRMVAGMGGSAGRWLPPCAMPRSTCRFVMSVFRSGSSRTDCVTRCSQSSV